MDKLDTVDSTSIRCPCGNALTYGQCCQQYHSNIAVADTPERLMRSRYCAFVLSHFHYLISTHHPDFLHGLTEQQLAQGKMEWLGLEVLSSKQQSDRGEVTFKAWYIEDRLIDAIYERSSFIQREGRWFYTQGQQMPTRLPGRNEACLCNSGKKFKQCCAKRIS
jgi:SEC-C motif-containing protein